MFLDSRNKGNPKISEEKIFEVLNRGDEKFINPWNSDVCRVPSRHLLIGASETGKSFAVCNFLMYERNPYVYPYGKTYYLIHPTSAGQVKLENLKEYLNTISRKEDSMFDSFTVVVEKNINNSVGMIMSAVDDCKEKKLNFMLIIDDAYGTETVKSNFLVELYCKGRHKNISVMFLTQVALSNKVMKDIRRNINYLWLFKSYQEDVDALLSQIISKRYPEKREEFYQNYLKAIDVADYGYFVYSPFIAKNQYRFQNFWPPNVQPKPLKELVADLQQNKENDVRKEELDMEATEQVTNYFKHGDVGGDDPLNQESSSSSEDDYTKRRLARIVKHLKPKAKKKKK